MIGEFSNYYGLAIRRHPDSVEDMKKEIWASFYHKISTNDNPQHSRCDPAWCQYLIAQAEGVEYDHKPPLREDIQALIEPIFKDLSADPLLKRCLGGETQNNNESVNNCIWRIAPKTINCGAKIVEIATFIGAGTFNDGHLHIKRIMALLGIKIGYHSNKFSEEIDQLRLKRAEGKSAESTKEARTARRMANSEKEDFYQDEEGVLYGPGIDD